MSAENLPDIIARTCAEIGDEKRSILEHYAITYSFDTQSPIEWAINTALHESLEWEGIGSAQTTDAQRVLVPDHESDLEGVYIIPQAQIGRYRVDFLICMMANGVSSKLVIECDGHDFHERTKAQAARDKSRDRDLLAIGLPVMRFTGSEIYASPLKCARQVWSIVKGAWFDTQARRSAIIRIVPNE